MVLRAPGCDYEGSFPPVYTDIVDPTKIVCRCLVCGRCGKHTGNNTQGHWWSLCKATGTIRGHHFCCPSGCELEEGK